MFNKVLAIFFLAFSAFSLWADEFLFQEETDEMVSRMDINQWYNDIAHLAGLNRYYRNPGVHEARDWIKEQFESLGMKTHLEEFAMRGTNAFNVVAQIEGSEKPDDIYIIGAHYDSISEKPNELAPGAEDNASGTAGLLSLARLITQKPKATIRFVAFSGEEAGLFGSKAHVQKINQANEKSKVKGVFIMDMIGFSADDDLDVLIETSQANKAIVDLSVASFNKYCSGRIESTFNYFGSDHVPFIDAGMPAALSIENDYTEYPAYHRSNDVIDNINKDMGLQVLKMLAGVMGYWIN